MIDTLTISKQLQEAGVARKEADAIAIQMAKFAESELASKQNLKETELSLQKEIEKVRLSLQKEIEEVRLSLQKEIEGVRLSLQKEIEGVRLEIHKVESGILKWVAGFLVGQTALLFTLIKFFG